MIYIGMQDQWYTFNMFDAQAWYARDVVLGRITLPSDSEMEADFNQWREREGTLASDEDCIRYQGDYTKMLMEATDYPSFDIEGVNQQFLLWEQYKHNNIMTFRDQP